MFIVVDCDALRFSCTRNNTRLTFTPRGNISISCHLFTLHRCFAEMWTAENGDDKSVRNCTSVAAACEIHCEFVVTFFGVRCFAGKNAVCVILIVRSHQFRMAIDQKVSFNRPTKQGKKYQNGPKSKFEIFGCSLRSRWRNSRFSFTFRNRELRRKPNWLTDWRPEQFKRFSVSISARISAVRLRSLFNLLIHHALHRRWRAGDSARAE